MSQPKDLFSGHSSEYAIFRPAYPKVLYDFIVSHLKEREFAWDCGCGNGQVAHDLVPYFKKIAATDLSAKQIEKAVPAATISYSVSAAEHTPFPDHAFDLITVGQALHWFDLPEFYKEVRRVAKPDGLLAVWGYGLLHIHPLIDQHIHHFYTEVIGSYWDKERKLIDEEYKTIPFPFEEIASPPFDFQLDWTIHQLQGYLTTWSSVQKYIQRNGHNPVDDLIKRLEPLWTNKIMKVTFPLFMRLGKVQL